MPLKKASKLSSSEAAPSPSNLLQSPISDEPLRPPSRVRRNTPPPAAFNAPPEEGTPSRGGRLGRRRQPAAGVAAVPEASPVPPPLPMDEPLAAPSRIRSGARIAPPEPFGGSVEDVVRDAGGTQRNGKVQQMLHLHNLLHNPLNIDLREAMLDNSSSRDEIAARLADLRHRVATIEALSTVLKEEVQQLEQLLEKRDTEQTTADKTPVGKTQPGDA